MKKDELKAELRDAQTRLADCAEHIARSLSPVAIDTKQQRTEAVIALAREIFVREVSDSRFTVEHLAVKLFEDAKIFFDAADAYRKQSTEGGADES
jgi:hypothetical protein